MKFVDEYRDPERVTALAQKIHHVAEHHWTIMEICGGQTHTIVRHGLDRLLPANITLIHGPGCPVCVTPIELIDAACILATCPEVIVCSFGDMLRVPGSQEDLLSVKSRGGNVRTIYSPLDAVRIAQENPTRQIVNFAVGFETTAPAQAMSVLQAQELGLNNYSLLVAHVLVPPAMEAMLASPDNRVQGFLAAGHVCTIMGIEAYEPICQRFKIPIVVTGFEPVDILEGIFMLTRQLETQSWKVENQYSRSVQPSGNTEAQIVLNQVFAHAPRNWRGIGTIPHSGLQLRPEFSAFDALIKFQDILNDRTAPDIPQNECQSGAILQGLMKPSECPAFGTSCTPTHPLGAPMVSSEGACAAYFRYRSSEVLAE